MFADKELKRRKVLQNQKHKRFVHQIGSYIFALNFKEAVY